MSIVVVVVLRSGKGIVPIACDSTAVLVWLRVSTAARTADRLLHIVAKPDGRRGSTTTTSAVVTSIEVWVMVVIRLLRGVLRVIHHVLLARHHDVIEARVHAVGWLWETVWSLLLMLRVVSVILVRLLLMHHHVQHARVLLLHLLGHASVHERLLGWITTTSIIALLVEEDAIVLSVGLLRLVRRVVILSLIELLPIVQRLLTQES